MLLSKILTQLSLTSLMIKMISFRSLEISESSIPKNVKLIFQQDQLKSHQSSRTVSRPLIILRLWLIPLLPFWLRTNNRSLRLISRKASRIVTSITTFRLECRSLSCVLTMLLTPTMLSNWSHWTRDWLKRDILSIMFKRDMSKTRKLLYSVLNINNI